MSYRYLYYRLLHALRRENRAVDDAANIADRLIETITKSADAQIATAKEGSGAENQATSKAIEMVSATARSMVDMVTKNSGAQYNPLEMIEKIGVTMAPKGVRSELATVNSDVLDLMKIAIEANKSSYEQALTALTQQAKQFEFMQTVLQERAQNAAAVAAAVPPLVQPKSFGDTGVGLTVELIGGRNILQGLEDSSRIVRLLDLHSVSFNANDSLWIVGQNTATEYPETGGNSEWTRYAVDDPAIKPLWVKTACNPPIREAI